MKPVAIICLLATAATAACASGGASTGAYAVSGGTASANGARQYNLAAPATNVWTYLPVAYSRLGLKITKYDLASHVITGERLGSHEDFDGKPLRDLVNCGETASDVNIEVSTTLGGNDSSTTLANLVNATASGASGDVTKCSANSVISDSVVSEINQAVTEATR